MNFPSPEEIERAIGVLVHLKRFEPMTDVGRESVQIAVDVLSALKSGELVGKEEVKAYEETLEYFADENNWNCDPDSSYIEMKRPGGGYQQGIVLVSHNLRPWILARQVLPERKK